MTGAGRTSHLFARWAYRASTKPIFREHTFVTCPLKVNIKSETWVIYRNFLHRHSSWTEGHAHPAIPKSEWVLGRTSVLSRAAPFPSITMVWRVCPLEPSFGRWCTAFKRSHFHRGKFIEKPADWKCTCVCVPCIDSCAPSQPRPWHLQSSVTLHPLWGPLDPPHFDQMQ